MVMNAPKSCVDTIVTGGACACVHERQRGGYLGRSGPLTSVRGYALFRVTTVRNKRGHPRIVPVGRLTARAIQGCLQWAGRIGKHATTC